MYFSSKRLKKKKGGEIKFVGKAENDGYQHFLLLSRCFKYCLPRVAEHRIVRESANLSSILIFENLGDKIICEKKKKKTSFHFCIWVLYKSDTHNFCLINPFPNTPFWDCPKIKAAADDN